MAGWIGYLHVDCIVTERQCQDDSIFNLMDLRLVRGVINSCCVSSCNVERLWKDEVSSSAQSPGQQIEKKGEFAVRLLPSL